MCVQTSIQTKSGPPQEHACTMPGTKHWCVDHRPWCPDHHPAGPADLPASAHGARMHHLDGSPDCDASYLLAAGVHRACLPHFDHSYDCDTARVTMAA
eukprot:scaffold93414_cov18-Tisochrysis_lutea.AAC.1